MNLPLFFSDVVGEVNELITLPEESSKHIVQVLRMKAGENLLLTNGKGYLLNASIIDDHKKRTTVKIIRSDFSPAPSEKISVAISLLKNANRFEWFLEKATELGISEIVPLICERTERQHFRMDRMKTILVSAMLQSQQSWLPILSEPIKFHTAITTFLHEQKYIAHCADDEMKKDFTKVLQPGSRIILIGPEGDFTSDEIALAKSQSYAPVTLGSTRLRTETAGMVAAVLLR